MIREIEPADKERVRDFLLKYAGATRMVSRGVLHQIDELPGLIVEEVSKIEGILNYNIVVNEFEAVTLYAATPGRGFGAQLLQTARQKAQVLGCRRLWLITTNDNEPAIRFYKREGMRQVAIHHNALLESRKIKPEIPMLGWNSLPINDEIEFEFSFE